MFCYELAGYCVHFLTRYGRKIILISSLLVYAVSSTCIAFVETFLLLGIALFIDGASCTAFYNVLYVLGKSLN